MRGFHGLLLLLPCLALAALPCSLSATTCSGHGCKVNATCLCVATADNGYWSGQQCATCAVGWQGIGCTTAANPMRLFFTTGWQTWDAASVDALLTGFQVVLSVPYGTFVAVGTYTGGVYFTLDVNVAASNAVSIILKMRDFLLSGLPALTDTGLIGMESGSLVPLTFLPLVTIPTPASTRKTNSRLLLLLLLLLLLVPVTVIAVAVHFRRKNRVVPPEPPLHVSTEAQTPVCEQEGNGTGLSPLISRAKGKERVELPVPPSWATEDDALPRGLSTRVEPPVDQDLLAESVRASKEGGLVALSGPSNTQELTSKPPHLEQKEIQSRPRSNSSDSDDAVAPYVVPKGLLQDLPPLPLPPDPPVAQTSIPETNTSSSKNVAQVGAATLPGNQEIPAKKKVVFDVDQTPSAAPLQRKLTAYSFQQVQEEEEGRDEKQPCSSAVELSPDTTDLQDPMPTLVQVGAAPETVDDPQVGSPISLPPLPSSPAGSVLSAPRLSVELLGIPSWDGCPTPEAVSPRTNEFASSVLQPHERRTIRPRKKSNSKTRREGETEPQAKADKRKIRRREHKHKKDDGHLSVELVGEPESADSDAACDHNAANDANGSTGGDVILEVPVLQAEPSPADAPVVAPLAVGVAVEPAEAPVPVRPDLRDESTETMDQDILVDPSLLGQSAIRVEVADAATEADMMSVISALAGWGDAVQHAILELKQEEEVRRGFISEIEEQNRHVIVLMTRQHPQSPGHTLAGQSLMPEEEQEVVRLWSTIQQELKNSLKQGWSMLGEGTDGGTPPAAAVHESAELPSTHAPQGTAVTQVAAAKPGTTPKPSPRQWPTRSRPDLPPNSPEPTTDFTLATTISTPVTPDVCL